MGQGNNDDNDNPSAFENFQKQKPFIAAGPK